MRPQGTALGQQLCLPSRKMTHPLLKDHWSFPPPPPPFPLCGHCCHAMRLYQAVLLPDGERVLVYGGEDSNRRPLGDAYVLDLQVRVLLWQHIAHSCKTVQDSGTSSSCVRVHACAPARKVAALPTLLAGSLTPCVCAGFVMGPTAVQHQGAATSAQWARRSSVQRGAAGVWRRLPGIVLFRPVGIGLEQRDVDAAVAERAGPQSTCWPRCRAGWKPLVLPWWRQQCQRWVCRNSHTRACSEHTRVCMRTCACVHASVPQEPLRAAVPHT